MPCFLCHSLFFPQIKKSLPIPTLFYMGMSITYRFYCLSCNSRCAHVNCALCRTSMMVKSSGFINLAL